MPKHDDRISLRQMQDHAREAMDMISGRTFDNLCNERILELALVRLVEIVGEAAGRVSQEG